MKIHRTDPQNAKEKKASRKGKAAVVKMKLGEKETADLFRASLEDVPTVEVVQRNQGRLSGHRRPEIAVVPKGNYHDPFVHIENKRAEKKSVSLEEAFEQAVADHKPGSVPVAVVKRFRQAETITLYLHDYLPMQRAWLMEDADA